uniref:Ribosomal protein n=1 Tax=Hildenbrandia rivularis TaxID=135206 RepID=A0A1C9CFQ5_9FLOR|nr:ribosomal protein L1 [Hildenbrandia rivularis]AOM67187.1 ribosomal protein L1 [Hildenbrandia rivularis]
MTKLSNPGPVVKIHAEANKLYTPIAAINFMKSQAKANFIETAEVHVALNLNPKYVDQQLRSSVILPKGLGKTIKIAVITRGERVSEALSAGAFIAGSDDLVEAIASGHLNFDKLIATPDAMPLIAKLGKILGPRGLMPSPKAGTVTTDLGSSIADFKKGKIEYKVDKTGIIHLPFGKVSFSSEDLLLNLRSILMSIARNRPSGVKGKFWKTIYICSTMGSSIAISFTSFL